MSATAFRFVGSATHGAVALAADVEGGMVLQLARTAEGDAENLRASHELSKPARELLRRFNGELSIDQCLAGIPEARLADAMTLFAPGLVRTVSCVATSRDEVVQLRPLIDALFDLSSDDLYRVLTHQAKRRLGLIHGFRVVLALERCVGQHERRALALRFVDAIWRLHGEHGLRPLRACLRA